MKKIKKVFCYICAFCVASVMSVFAIGFCVGAVMCIVSIINNESPNPYEWVGLLCVAIMGGAVGVIMGSEE